MNAASELMNHLSREALLYWQQQARAGLRTAFRLQQSAWQGLQHQIDASIVHMQERLSEGTAQDKPAGWPLMDASAMLPAMGEAWNTGVKEAMDAWASYGNECSTVFEKHAYRMQQLLESDATVQQLMQAAGPLPMINRFLADWAVAPTSQRGEAGAAHAGGHPPAGVRTRPAAAAAAH